MDINEMLLNASNDVLFFITVIREPRNNLPHDSRCDGFYKEYLQALNVVTNNITDIH